MEIKIIVTETELQEDGITAAELKSRIIKDLDEAGDYPGFNVEVEIRAAG